MPSGFAKPRRPGKGSPLSVPDKPSGIRKGRRSFLTQRQRSRKKKTPSPKNGVAADIATPDRQGTYWYKSGDLVATVTTGAAGQVDEVKFSPTRTQATYDFLKITHDGTKGEVTVTLPLGKYIITEVQAPYGFVLTQQSYTVEFGWDNQKNDIVLAKTIVSHEQNGDKKCSYSIVNVKDASDAHKIGQILVFENARVLPTPEKPGDKVSKIGVGIYKQDREALTYLPGAVYELYTVDDIYSADGTKLLDAGAKLATGSPTNESGFTWFDVDVPIRGEYYIDPAGPRSTSRENSGRYRIVEMSTLVRRLVFVASTTCHAIC